ncbi:MAG TPA: sigma 54-interacting transcriptional regulator [Kofleriaceae bacterium]|nr:sigma 54-interacting transcriptional regulator [Kofleriaceae bacterium]
MKSTGHGFDETTAEGITPRDPDPAQAPDPGRHYVVVFEADSSRMFELPADGEIRVGRGEDVPLRLHETAISRHHAVIRMAAGQATVIDEGSHNGTRVNGERVVGARALASGDVIAICTTTLVYHASVPAVGSATVLEHPAFRQRVAQEIERSRAYHRPLVVMAATLGRPDRPRIALALERRLRLIDVPGWGGSDQLFVVMPELTADEALEAAARLLSIVQPVAPAARVGFASWPVDGFDVDTLLEAARTSALDAPPSTIASATRAFRTLEVGDRHVIVADPTMIQLYGLIERLARSQLTVLICGETGTGKELAARAIHEWSSRRARPIVAINCAAIAETLIESELFGHEKGAFTGAVGTKIGLLERAAGGTVFLDEVGELSAGAQAKLLRVLEHRSVTRLGDIRERAIDIRVVAATNRDLEAEISAGRFRRDLYFRLSGAMLWLPPLRDRKREIAILAQRFVEEACERMRCTAKALSDDALRLLSSHDWPGNIRELHNVMEYAAATVEGPVLEAHDLEPRLARPRHGAPQAEPEPSSDAAGAAPQDPASPRFRPIEDEIRDLERIRMEAALRATGGHQRQAAELIAMPLRTFQTKAKLYGLSFDPRKRR